MLRTRALRGAATRCDWGGNGGRRVCEPRCVRATWFMTVNEAVEEMEEHMLGARTWVVQTNKPAHANYIFHTSTTT